MGPTALLRKLRHRELKQLVQIHPARKWQSQGLNPSNPAAPESVLLTISVCRLSHDPEGTLPCTVTVQRAHTLIHTHARAHSHRKGGDWAVM